MAKWTMPHRKGMSKTFPDGSVMIDGIIETDDAKEPKISHIIRTYYGAVPFVAEVPKQPTAPVQPAPVVSAPAASAPKV